MVSCNGCDNTWNGLAMAHCSLCHQTFSTVSNFDKHIPNYTCQDPRSVGLQQNKRGTWLQPTEKDISEIWKQKSQ